MKYDPSNQHRRSIRLKGYVYSQPGYYFVMICVRNSTVPLSEIFDDRIQLTPFGFIIDQEWNNISAVYQNVQVDEYIIMPNHFHGILQIKAPDTKNNVGAIHELPLRDVPPHNIPKRKQLLPKLIGRFKMCSAKRINQIIDLSGTPFWQRNYYDRIIRDAQELYNTRQYIQNNPLKWNQDDYYVQYHKTVGQFMNCPYVMCHHLPRSIKKTKEHCYEKFILPPHFHPHRGNPRADHLFHAAV
jgi:putative transposase